MRFHPKKNIALFRVYMVLSSFPESYKMNWIVLIWFMGWRSHSSSTTRMKSLTPNSNDDAKWVGWEDNRILLGNLLLIHIYSQAQSVEEFVRTCGRCWAKGLKPGIRSSPFNSSGRLTLGTSFWIISATALILGPLRWGRCTKWMVLHRGKPSIMDDLGVPS